MALEAEAYTSGLTETMFRLSKLWPRTRESRIFDIKMPRMDGMELWRASPAVRNAGDLPDLQGRRDHELFGLKMGADDYIGSPFRNA